MNSQDHPILRRLSQGIDRNRLALALAIFASLVWMIPVRSAAQAAGPEIPAYCSSVPAPSQTLPGATAFTYRTVGDRVLRIHILKPQDDDHKRPALLLFFGGGFRTGDVASLLDSARIFSEHGYVVAMADYRILCRDGVTALAGLDDAKAADSWLRHNARRLGVDPRRIVLGGASAGGLLAASTTLRAPARQRPAGLLLINPVLDLTNGMWAKDQTLKDGAASSASALPIDTLPPTMIFHGTADEIVPIESSRRFCARAVAAGRACRLVEYPGMPHSFNDKKKVVPSLGLSPFDDTTAKAVAFLEMLPKP